MIISVNSKLIGAYPVKNQSMTILTMDQDSVMLRTKILFKTSNTSN